MMKKYRELNQIHEHTVLNASRPLFVHIKVYRLNVNKNFNYFGMPNCAISLHGHIHTHLRIPPHNSTNCFYFILFYDYVKSSK